MNDFILSKTVGRNGEKVEKRIPIRHIDGKTDRHTFVIDPTVKDQPILGLGSIFTATDLYALTRMSPEKRDEALTLMFDREKGAGWSLMRIPFASTDWEVTPDFYSYDDVPYGEDDFDLERFSIDRAKKSGIFPILRRAKEINPELRFHASVWAIPAWMKDSRSLVFGRFRPECAEVYARYLAKCVLAYREEGIVIDAVSPQNESLTACDRETPATRMTWWVQKEVVLAMRRVFDELCPGTKIWFYDHNFDTSEYFVTPFLTDKEARAAIDGVAYHDYGGSTAPMEAIHREYPDLPLYLTERTIRTVPDMANLVAELHAGARCYNQWQSISDDFGGPHLFLAHPFVYRRGAKHNPATMNMLYVERDDRDALHTAPAYEIYGLFTRALRPGSVRVDATFGEAKWLTGVSFLDPKGENVTLIAVNATESEQPLAIRCGSVGAELTQPAMTVASYTFPVPEDAIPVPEYVPTAAEPTWDVAVADILTVPDNGRVRLRAVLENVGEIPVPNDASVQVTFTIDGDCVIGRANASLPPLKPGEQTQIEANVPVGMPYDFSPFWIPESGRHQIFARATVGNVYAEENADNNVFAREFIF